jgi:hypothetical protein
MSEVACVRTEADLEDALAEGLPHIMVTDKILARRILRVDKKSKAGKRACTLMLTSIAAYKSGSWMWSKVFGGPVKKETWKTRKPEGRNWGLIATCALALGGIVASNLANPCRLYELRLMATGLQLLRKDVAAIFREEERDRQLRAGHRRRRERHRREQQRFESRRMRREHGRFEEEDGDNFDFGGEYEEDEGVY